MKRLFLSLAVLVMALCANAQTNQFFWYNGNLMMGNPIAQIDSVTFGEGEPVDTLHIMLPRTIIKTVEVHDTLIVSIHDTTTIHDTIYLNCPIEGALSGEFSISPTQKIHFSGGNLQYNTNTEIWRFAEHQYDMIGEDESNVLLTDNGWIDIYGWGTGSNPTITSKNTNDYSTFVDWGTNPISNGGNLQNQWRTLSKAEWEYIFSTRPNADVLFALGKVNGVKGAIILPDNWQTPNGIIFKASTIEGMVSTGYSTAYYGSNVDHYEDNTYSETEWKQLEAAGAVFLPAANRFNQEIRGYYWSSTEHYSCAFCLFFQNYGLNPAEWPGRFNKQSVRLVQNIE